MADTMTFEIYQNGQLVRTEELSQDIIKIGKLPSSHLRLDDAHVSRIHAVIERSKDGGVYIIDLGSTRGTMVNGEKINKCKLSGGDEIALGGTKIIVRMAAVAPQANFDPDATQVSLSPAQMAAAAGAAGMSFGEEPTHVGVSPAAAAPAPARQAAPVQAASSARVQAQQPQAAAAPQAGASGVQTQGHYDDQGNWHDGTGGWYDPEGNYHDGTGGWYDTEGSYHDGEGGWYDTEGNYFSEAATNRVSDVDVYSEQYLHTTYDSSGSGALEVAFMWNDHVLAVNQYRKTQDVFVGEAQKNTFHLKHPSIPDAKFPLIKNEGGTAVLNFTDKMTGHFVIGDDELTMEQLIRSGKAGSGGFGQGSYSLPVTPQTRVRLGIGPNTVLIHHADAPKGVPLGLLNFDMGFVGNLALSTAMHAVFMFMVFFIPPGADDFSLDSFDVNNRFVSQIVKPEEPEKEDEPDWMKDKKDEEEGAKAKEDEGKAGKKDSKEKDKKMAVKGPKDRTEVQIAKDRDKAYNTGALDVLAKNQITANWGSGSQTLGMQAITAMGDNNGSRVGEAFGVGAFGRTGTGRGGGGVSERGFGAGSIGTAGRGGGGDGGSNYGRNAGQIDERATRVPKVIPGRPVVSGSLDKEIIRRVIRRHRREIKYCYERELVKNKNLAGKVIVSFTISGTGAVVAASARGGTLGNASVSSCIASKVRRWVFPEPNGGGIVRVSYPFVFAPQQ